MRWPALLLAWSSLAGCEPLPDLPAGVCGNHVIEAGEDCDGFAKEEERCRPPDASDSCHFDCAADAGGERRACPPGFGCDPDRICRRPRGDFARVAGIPGAVETLVQADFDGDRRADVLALEPAGALGFRKPAVHFFDEYGAPAASWSTTLEIATPVVSKISRTESDPHDDLIFSVGGLVIMRGESDHTLSPVPRPSYFLEDSRVHSVPVRDRGIENVSPLLLLRQSDEGFVLDRPHETEELQEIATLDGHLDELLGEPVWADVFEDDDEFPCWDVTFALAGASRFSLYQACRRGADGSLQWRDQALVTTLEFEPPSVATGAPVIADLDGDRHLDLVIAAERGPYAAFGDGESLGALRPFAIESSDPRLPPPSGAPIAAGDFSGDGLADLIMPDQALISVAGADGSIGYQHVFDALGKPWTTALVADLNDDGRLDVIAASDAHPDIDFLAGTGNGGPNPFVIPTIRPVSHLTASDFDGDQIADLAFVEPRGAADGVEDQLSVAFGTPAGPPALPKAIAHLEGVTEITALTDSVGDSVADLVVIEDVRAAGSATSTGLDAPAGAEPSSDAAAKSAVSSSISIMFGNGDRNFYSPSLLTNFAADGTIQGADSLTVTAGSFLDGAKLDLALIGERDDPLIPGGIEYSLWLSSDVRQHNPFMRRVDFEFDARFVPVRAPGRELTVSTLAVDFDGDSVSELLLAGPSRDGTDCLMQTARYDEAANRFSVNPLLSIGDGCEPEPAPQSGDFDGDGWNDLAILTGSTGAGGHIRVFFGDGQGGIAELGEQPFVSAPDGESIRAFTLFQETEDAPYRLAYVTARTVRLFQMRGSDRRFVAVGSNPDGVIELDLLDATGVAAGDVSGDGITDLIVAEGGTVSVLRARLVER